MIDADTLSIILAGLAVGFAAFVLGVAVGIHLSGRRYRHALRIIDGTVFAHPPADRAKRSRRR